MICVEGFYDCIVYSRLWSSKGKHNFLMYIDAFKLYNVIEDSILNPCLDPDTVMTQCLPMELFNRKEIFSGYSVETLGDHIKESSQWVEKVYDFEDNFQELIKRIKATINVKSLYFVLNIEFTNNETKNHFKLKHSRFLNKTA